MASFHHRPQRDQHTSCTILVLPGRPWQAVVLSAYFTQPKCTLARSAMSPDMTAPSVLHDWVKNPRQKAQKKRGIRKRRGPSYLPTPLKKAPCFRGPAVRHTVTGSLSMPYGPTPPPRQPLRAHPCSSRSHQLRQRTPPFQPLSRRMALPPWCWPPRALG